MTRDPTQTARLVDNRLVVEDCVFCGGTHHHGAADHEPGDTTHRGAHCSPSGRATGYYLEIVAAPEVNA